jgi:tetratricopeptide (TPR) repeat protein
MEREIPLKKALFLLLIVAVSVIAIGTAIGYAFFWNQFEGMTKDEVRMRSVQSLIKQHPKSVTGYLALGNLYLNQGKPEEALKEFKKALALKKNEALVNFNMGIAYMQLEKFDEAIKLMEPLSKNSPYNYEAQYYTGAAYYMKGDYAKAVEKFKQAVMYNNGAADGHLFLAKAYYKKGDRKMAEEHLNKALRMVPKYDEAIEFKKAMAENKKID